MIYDLIKEIP